MAHERRRIVHFTVTSHPTAEWTAQQMREAFPRDAGPRYVLRDRDRIFGRDVVEQIKAMGTKQVLSAPAFAVATCLRGTCDRRHSARMPGSHDRVQRAKFVPASSTIHRVFPPQPCSPGVGEGYSGAAPNPEVRVWANRLDIGAGRTASPIRAARRLRMPTTDACFHQMLLAPVSLFCGHRIEIPYGPTFSFLIPNSSTHQ